MSVDSVTLSVSSSIPRSLSEHFRTLPECILTHSIPAARNPGGFVCPRPGQLCRALKGNTVSTKTTTRPPDTRAVRRRVSLADRIALRVGMSLIIWSRRTRKERPEVDLATLARLERERRQREADWITQGATMRMWR